MQIKDLIPWGRERTEVSRQQSDIEDPMLALQRDINRVFGEFWSRFDRSLAPSNGFYGGMPRADVSETDDAVEVSVELPGMDGDDIEVSLSEDVLTIRGEKKAEREEKKTGTYLSERSYGSFYRAIPLPPWVDAEKAAARFKKGVLTVTLPKTPEAQKNVRRIEVRTS